LRAGVELQLVGHVHVYQRNYPSYPNANKGNGAMDNSSCSPNLGNETNPKAIYTNPLFMTTLVQGAPGDQEVRWIDA
jgi:hypothetical protein